MCVEYRGITPSPPLLFPPIFMASVSEAKKFFKSQMLVDKFQRILDTKSVLLKVETPGFMTNNFLNFSYTL
jgi:hypothetical protein